VDAAVAANGNIGNLNRKTTLPSTVQQMANYLSRPGGGGMANPQALYVISSGGNDVTFAIDNFSTLSSRETYLANQAQVLANAIRNLQVTGAQHILVNGLPGGVGTLGAFYTQALFADLSAAGVNFIGADVQAFVQEVENDPGRYGFTQTTVLPGVLVPVRAPLAFGPPLWAAPSYQDGASGAPTRRRQAPNTRTLGP
jgi:phospholipase/lecithinase/hemolysin